MEITRTEYWIDTAIGKLKVVLDPNMPRNFIGFAYENGSVQLVGYNLDKYAHLAPKMLVGG